MLDTHVRTSYASAVAPQSTGRSVRSKAQVADAAQPTPISTQGPGFTSHVVAPLTLLAAQEAREGTAVRRDDPQKTPNGQSQGNARSASGEELTEDQQQQVEKLKKIDREVRAHERAHRSAGGSLTGPAHYTYTRGPDGQMYATSGEVSIDTGREASAAATAAKMETIIRAALAPANPSSQDVAVAAQARQILNEVSQEAREERLNLNDEDSDGQNAENKISPESQSFSRANRAYRERGAQDGESFLAQQAQDAFSATAKQGFSFVI